MQMYTVRAQTGGKILVMPEHFEISYLLSRKPIFIFAIQVPTKLGKIKER